jgi:DNA-binding CsgD family transcriptional regulator/tetratricopeptide (TPR) repeat protein
MIRLLERDAELDALEAAFARACAGVGSVVLVAGEAGIGKTSLVRAFADTTRAAAHVGRCEPLEVPAPLAPLHDLAPHLGEAFAGSLSSDAATVARRLLEALDAAPPAIVVIEDIHWADTATLDVLRVAARRIDRVPAVMILTYRDDEASGTPARVLAGELATAPHVVRLAPRPLSPETVAGLATEVGLDGARLHAATGGNPFLVAESLAVPNRVPQTVLDAVLARTTRLSSAARGALDVAAVLGTNVDLGLLRDISQAEADAIDECIACGILVARGADLGFRHELTRAAVEEAISPPRRALLHTAVARALGAAPIQDHTRIAHHASAGGDRRLVVEHATSAAEQAERSGSSKEALAQRERALAAGDLAQRDELLLHVGAIAYLADRPDRAVEVLEELIASSSDVLVLARAHRHLGRAFWLLDRWEEAGASTRRAVELLEGAGNEEELAVATAWLSGFLALGLQSSEAVAVAERAVATARAVGNDEALAGATISLGLALGLGGDRAGLEHLRAGRELALTRGIRQQIIRGYVNGLVVAVVLRDYTECDALFAPALEQLEHMAILSSVDDITQSYARSLIDRGRLDEAAALLENAPRENKVEGVLTDTLVAIIHARRGENGAMPILDEALVQVEGAPDGFREGAVRLARAEAAWIAGDLDLVRHEALAGLAIDTMQRIPAMAGELAVWLTRCGGDAPGVDASEPFALELSGRWREAVDAWLALDCPFDAALASLPGDHTSARAAVTVLHRMGAAGGARAFARERARRGLSVPRGPRPATSEDAHGLTTREREVLALMASGLRNSEIATALHITEKTAGHHVSACLRKLGAHTRTEAVAMWGHAAPKMGSPPDVPEAAAP